ncbi:MAG TPA: hypothetical protein VGI64_04625 [Streptosporangiaceae bacterium]|jgi:hypothetical protein
MQQRSKRRGSRRSQLAAGLCAAGVALAGCGGSGHGAAGQLSAHLRGSSGAGSGGSVFGAGGGSGSGSGNAGPPDGSLAGIHACQLIPPAVVSRVIGATDPQQGNSTTACFYNQTVDNGSSFILMVSKRSGYDFAKSFSQGAATTGPISFRTVPGYGDDAFQTVQSAGGHDYEFWAAKGGLALNISVDSDSPADEQKVRELMQSALAKL